MVHHRATGTDGVAPWEWDGRDSCKVIISLDPTLQRTPAAERTEEEVARVGNTGKHVVPSQERGDESETAAGDTHVRRCRRVRDLVLDGEEQEGQVEGEEEGEEGHGRPQREHEHAEGEEEPRPQVQRERGVEAAHARRGVGVGVHDAKRGGQDDAEGDPEAAVGGEGGGAKGVADGHFPHACEELDQAAVGVGEADDDVGGGD